MYICILSSDNAPMYIYHMNMYVYHEWVAVTSVYISNGNIHHMDVSHSYVEGQRLSH